MICEDCHWFSHERLTKPCSNGKIYPCSNIGVPGWDTWDEKQQPPETCSEYCKTGEYVPTGVWAGVAAVVEKVAELINEEENT